MPFLLTVIGFVFVVSFACREEILEGLTGEKTTADSKRSTIYKKYQRKLYLWFFFLFCIAGLGVWSSYHPTQPWSDADHEKYIRERRELHDKVFGPDNEEQLKSQEFRDKIFKTEDDPEVRLRKLQEYVKEHQ